MSYSTKEKFNTNKAVVVVFPAYTSLNLLTNTVSADIYVPFPVKELNIKGIDLDFDADGRMVYFTSSLVNNGPLGSGYAGILCDNSSSVKQLSYIFDVPRDINGSYNFTYNILDDSAIYWAQGFSAGGPEQPGMPEGRVLFMLEFIGYK